MAEHSNGLNPNCYTYTRRPVRSAYSECFDDVWEAIGREKQIKRWTRMKKETLIRGRHEALPQHSSCRNLSHSATKGLRQTISVLRGTLSSVSRFDCAHHDRRLDQANCQQVAAISSFLLSYLFHQPPPHLPPFLYWHHRLYHPPFSLPHPPSSWLPHRPSSLSPAHPAPALPSPS